MYISIYHFKNISNLYLQHERHLIATKDLFDNLSETPKMDFTKTKIFLHINVMPPKHNFDFNVILKYCIIFSIAN